MNDYIKQMVRAGLFSIALHQIVIKNESSLNCIEAIYVGDGCTCLILTHFVLTILFENAFSSRVGLWPHFPCKLNLSLESK